MGRRGRHRDGNAVRGAGVLDLRAPELWRKVGGVWAGRGLGLLAWRRAILPALAIGIAVMLGLWKISLNGGRADFEIFYLSAQHLRAPYDLANLAALPDYMQGKTAFIYPPTFLLLAAPFSALPYPVAFVSWAALSFGLFVWAATALHPRAPVLLIAALAGVVVATALGAPRLYDPLFEALLLGQTTFWIGACVVGGGALVDRRPVLAGVLLGLAACIKPQALLLAPIFLWGRWRAMTAAAVTGLVVVILTTLLLGWERWPEWVSAVQAFKGARLEIQPAGLVDAVWWPVLLAIAGATIAWRDRTLTGFLVGGALAAPYMQTYDFAALCALAAVWIWKWREAPLPALVGVAFLAGLVDTAPAVLAALLILAIWFAAICRPLIPTVSKA